MKPIEKVPVRVIRGCVACGATLMQGTTAEISECDYKALEQLGKVELDLDAIKASETDSQAAEEPPEGDQDAPTSIDTLELAAAPTKALKDAGLGTLELLAEYVAGGNDLDELRGVGQSTEAKVLAALRASGLLEESGD